MNKLITLALTGLALAALTPSLSSAGSFSDKCKNYADTATNQYQDAQANNCGFSGPAWSNDTMYHYGWCMRGNNHRSTQWGTNKRAKALKSCKSAGSPKPGNSGGSMNIEETCRNYANKAIQQNNLAQQRGCGFSGPVWSGNFLHHFGWCMRGGNYKHTNWGTNERRAALKQCK